MNPLLTYAQLVAGELVPAPANAGSPQPSYSPIDGQAVLADFANRLRDLESAVKLSVPSDRITSMIALTKDTMLIQAEKIQVVGEVSFFDWMRDVNGIATGVIDPSITQIRGGVIRTGKVVSLDGHSWIDLDATTTTAFLKANDGTNDTVLIRANGQFALGPTAGKQLVWNGSNLVVGSAALLDSTAVGTVVSNAADGASALAGLADKLAKAGGDTLTGIIDLQVTTNYNAGVRVGSVTWNTSTGAITGGSGVVMTRKGLLGVNSGAVTFSIDATTGAALFAGDVVTAGQVKASGTTNVGSFYGAIIGLNTTNYRTGIIGSDTASLQDSFGGGGVMGSSVNGNGVVGFSSSTAYAGGQFSNSSSGAGLVVYNTGTGVGITVSGGAGAYALNVSGTMAISSSALVTNLNADKVDGYDASAFLLAGATAVDSDKVDGYHASAFLLVGGTAADSSKLGGASAGNSSGNIPISNGTVCTNLNAQMWQGIDIFAVSGGSQTPTMGTNKPGASGGGPAGWLNVTLSGNTYYMPLWS